MQMSLPLIHTAEGHDGIKTGGLERREVAEDHPRHCREEEGDQADPSVEDEGHVARSPYPSFAKA